MKIHWREVAAFVACLSLLLVQSASAQRQRDYQTVSDAAEMASASLASYNSFENCGCDDCSSGSCDGGSCGLNSCDSGGFGAGLGLGGNLLDRPGQFFAGAEYIYARASFSEALAYVLVDSNDPQGGAHFVEYDFGYESSYRFYGGYQFCDCGGAITFNFARYSGEAAFNVNETPGVEVFAPYEVENPGPNNGSLAGNAEVEINSYDVTFSRTIPLGSPLSCGTTGCGDSCCDDGCCGCGDSCGCWCPAWDITWSAGVRFAEVGWSRSQVGSFQPTAGPVLVDDLSSTRLSFEGTGARIGLLGRRYFGRRGLASIYAKGDISLLVGNMHIRTDTQDVDNGGTVLRSHENSARRVIPVTEIEAGLSAHLGNHVTLSGGYFIAAWHDLGMRDTYDFQQFQLSHYDDANILGFDGIFARAEVAY